MESANQIFQWPNLHISPMLSLSIILGVLALGVVASLVFPPKPEANQD